MKEIALVLATIFATCVAENSMACLNMSKEHGKTMITMMNSGETMKLSCPNNKMHMCKWWYHTAAIPDCYGNIEIGSKGTMKITKATVHNSGSYTLDMGTTTETHHIIVMPAGHTPMVIEGNHILNKTFKNMHMYTQLVQHVVFENVHFTNMHFHMMHFKNVTFKNCYFKWDQEHMHMMDVSSHSFHMQGKIDSINYCHVYMDDITMTECIIRSTKDTCEDHMEHDIMYFCMKHPHHPDCVHIKMLGCVHCYHDNEGGFPHNRHQHHYWKMNTFEPMHDADAHYIVYHTPNTHHTERQHCLEYDAVVYINRTHCVVKMIVAKEQCHHDADRHREVTMYINILISYIFHAVYIKIMIIMVIYNMRPEQPVREERVEDQGDLPFPIPAVEPN